MRTTIVATALLLGAILAACGGGGSGTTPTAAVGPQPPSPNQQVNNSFNGPTSQLSVTFAIPQRSESATELASTRARIQAIHGRKRDDASIRTMANTAATPQTRAFGQKLNAWATAYEKSTGRSPAYVSPQTYFAEIEVQSGTSVVQDVSIYCDGGPTCTGGATVPVGTGYTVSLYLYDDCNYLLSAGVANNVSVVAGSTTSVSITLDGVVAYLDVTSITTQLVTGNEQTIALDVNPLDAGYFDYSRTSNTITTPGTLITGSFVPITAVTLSLQSAYTDVSPSMQTLQIPTPTQSSPPGEYVFGPANFTYTGTGNETSVGWTVAAVATGSPIVSATPAGFNGEHYSTPFGSTTLSLAVNPRAIFIVAGPSPIPTIDGLPAYQLTPGSASTQTTTTIEFAVPTSTPQPISLSVSPNFNDSGSALTLSNNSCNSYVNGTLATAFPSPVPTYPPISAATMPPNGTPYNFTIAADPNVYTGSCSFTVTDGNNLSAVTTLYFDTTQFTVSSKARSK